MFSTDKNVEKALDYINGLRSYDLVCEFAHLCGESSESVDVSAYKLKQDYKDEMIQYLLDQWEKERVTLILAQSATEVQKYLKTHKLDGKYQIVYGVQSLGDHDGTTSRMLVMWASPGRRSVQEPVLSLAHRRGIEYAYV